MTTNVASLRANHGDLYERVTGLANMGRVTKKKIYLGSCKAFGIATHNVLVPKLERCRVDRWTTW